LTVDDDIEDEDNNYDDIDHDIDDDIINSDADDIHNDMEGDPNGADSVFVNQVEEWEEAVNNDDDSTFSSPGCGDKRPHSSTVSARWWRKPVKVHITTGVKPKAGDYKVAVQKVLGEAIPLYHSYLSMVNPYPGPMEEMRWAKKSWRDGCEECETQMAPNDEIIKLVSAHANCQLTRHTHLF